MKPKLKIWNGRWERDQHVYVAAYSKADAARLVIACLGYEPRGLRGEIDNYWSPDCWGDAMDGVEPERGIWVVKERFRSTRQRRRLIPMRLRNLETKHLPPT